MSTRRRQAPGVTRASARTVRVTWPAGTKRKIEAAVGLGSRLDTGGHAARSTLSDKLFARVFSNLVYAQIWEDPVADMNALQLGQTDRLVAIASGGCNVMSYLSARPAQIIAVDLNAHHLALLRLRLAAASHLPDYESFLRLFGDADEAGNLALYRDWLAPRLDARDRHYWGPPSRLSNARIKMFANGLTRHGVLGRFIGLAHWVARLHGVRLSDIADQKTLDDQRRFFEQEVNPIFDAPLMRVLASRQATLFGLGIPPAQAKLLAGDAGGDVIAVLRERVRRLACDFPIRENYFAMQAFTRSYRGCDPDHLPPYLQARHFEAVRSGAQRVTVVHESMTTLLEREASASLDAYVLLDAQDWMSEAQREALWRQIGRTARPGARVLFRTAGVGASLPTGAQSGWRYDADASSDALRGDRSAIYGGCHLYRRVG